MGKKGIMKDIISKILEDDSYTTNEDRIDAMAKELAMVVIPKNKYNDLSDRLKRIEAEKDAEIEELKTKNLTDEEKIKLEREKFEADKITLSREKSEIAVSKILSKNGITEETYGEDAYQSLVQDLVGDTVDVSSSKANNFINLIAKTKDTAIKETKTEMLKNTPTPKTGDEGKKVTKQELDNMTYSEMMNFMSEQPDLYQMLSQEQ